MWRLEIDNVAGIRTGSATLDPGLNVVQASNFQGKSSLVASIRTVMGATGQYDSPPLTEGADAGSVTLTAGSDTYEVTLEREDDGSVTRSGTPYLADETDQICARLFACLGEDNPIRLAVRNGDDLTDLLQAPLDVADIDSQIEALRAERRDLDDDIAGAERAGERLPAIQEEVTRLETELGNLQSRRETLAAEAERERRLDERTDRIAEKRSTLEEYERHIERQEATIGRLEERLEAKEAELASLDVPEEVDDDADVEAKAERVDALERKIDLVERLAQVTQEILEDGEFDLITDVDRSLAGDNLECWTCGGNTDADRLEERVAELNRRLGSLREHRATLEDEIATYEAKQREVERKRRERETLQENVKRLRLEIEEAEAELERLEQKRTALEAEFEDLESDLDGRDAAFDEKLTDVKVQINERERQLAEKRDRLAEREAQRETLAELRDRREEVEAEIEALRSRKRDAQAELVAQFDEAMTAVIDRFAPGFGGARLELRTDRSGEVEKIDLVIARDGRKTTVEALSEGEGELVGVVVALAGYRTFDVDERAPAILVDGIGQLAAEHLRNLTTYLRDASEVLLTTAYPEAGGFEGRTITPDDWDVVSDEQSAPTG